MCRYHYSQPNDVVTSWFILHFKGTSEGGELASFHFAGTEHFIPWLQLGIASVIHITCLSAIAVSYITEYSQSVIGTISSLYLHVKFQLIDV